MDVRQVSEGYKPQDGYEVRRFVVTTGSKREVVFILSPKGQEYSVTSILNNN